MNNRYNGVNTIAHNNHNTEEKIHGIEYFLLQEIQVRTIYMSKRVNNKSA